MKHTPDIGVVLLAAGSSSRMGKSKQLLEIEGEPLLRHSAKVALSENHPNVVVVLGANEQEHSKIIADLPVHIILNEEWQNGIGSSLKKGIAHFNKIYPSADAVIIMVCDQPLITSHHIERLIQEYKTSGKSIVASFYQNTPGVPALFDKAHVEEVLSLDDSQGAKKIILRHKEKVSLINLPEGAIDLDTMDDYHKLIGDR